MSDSKISRKGLTSWFKSNKKNKTGSRFSEYDHRRRRQSAGSHKVRFESINSTTETPETNTNKSNLLRKDTPDKEAPTKLLKSKNLFLSFRASTRRTKPKKNEVLKELLDHFDRSDFEFKINDSGDPENMNLIIEDTVEESKQELLRTADNEQDAECNIRDTYMTTATDAPESSTYNRHHSLDSIPQFKLSTFSVNTAASKKGSMTSVPIKSSSNERIDKESGIFHEV